MKFNECHICGMAKHKGHDPDCPRHQIECRALRLPPREGNRWPVWEFSCGSCRRTVQHQSGYRAEEAIKCEHCGAGITTDYNNSRVWCTPVATKIRPPAEPKVDRRAGKPGAGKLLVFVGNFRGDTVAVAALSRQQGRIAAGITSHMFAKFRLSASQPIIDHCMDHPGYAFRVEYLENGVEFTPYKGEA